MSKKLKISKNFSITIGIIFLLTFISCATTPVNISDSCLVSSNRLLEGYANVSTPSDETARIIVIRDSGFVGAGGKAILYLDGSPLASFQTRERIEFYPKYGNHLLGITPEVFGISSKSDLIENNFNFEAGKTYFFRISVFNQYLILQPTTQIH